LPNDLYRTRHGSDAFERQFGLAAIEVKHRVVLERNSLAERVRDLLC